VNIIRNKHQPAAILFDLDDTIVAWDAVADRSWAKTCYKFADSLSGLHPDFLIQKIKQVRELYLSDLKRHQFARLNLTAYRQEMVKTALSNLGIKNDELASNVANAYGIEREKALYILPGAVGSLSYWKNKEIRLALVTNGTSELQRRKLDRFNLASFFDYILIEGEFGAGKPDKRVFEEALAKLHVESSKAWMVGDNLEIDIAGAKNAGIYSIWVDWADTGLPESSPIIPNRIVKSIAEIT
jgi:putative hydrolase of the HAD superfamily